MARQPLAKARRFVSLGRHYRPDPRHPTLGDDFYDVVEADRLVIVRAVRKKPPHKTTEEIL
jgi:hypothetical protein